MINLIKLFNLFKNRPNHLAKFLLENNAFNEDFLSLLNDNIKLNEDISLKNFKNIDDMNDWFNSLLNDNKIKKNKKLTIKECNIKLKEFITDEKYEDAARIRDYMIKNKIKIN